MVVARNSAAASTLCHKWRERQSVKKTYLAFVRCWPPYHEQNLLEGSIDLPLAASRTERIKWEVRPVEDGGKASLTTWKVHKSSLGESGVTLELQPMTGRTHQLRIHCAAIGSGIEGDSLYGDNPIEWIGDKTQQTEQKASGDGDSKESPLRSKTLQLHAHKLTFPHPMTGKEMTFESPKPW
jgi:23S rRNA-/tRNA-specific pseudouridylate synthase